MISDNFEKKANFTFYQILAFGLIFLALWVFLIFKIYPNIFLVLESFQGKLESICGCENHFVFSNHPFLFSTVIFLAAIIIYLFVFSVIMAVKMKLLTAKFINAVLKHKKSKISKRLAATLQDIGLTEVIEIRESQPIIFCFGFLKPKICVSSGLIKNMSENELKAVLLHEQHHLRCKVPIKIFIVKLISKILFFLPGIKAAREQYFTFSELAADQQATKNFKDKTYLAGALYKAIKWSSAMTRGELALSFFASPIIKERVSKLIDNKYKPSFKFFSVKLSSGILLLALSIILFSGLFSTSSSAITSQDEAFCPTIPENTEQDCEVSTQEPICEMIYTASNSENCHPY